MASRTVGRAADLGIDSEPGFQWATVCEAHGTFVTSATRELARAATTVSFCECCQK